MTEFDEIKAHAIEDNTVPINDSHELSDRLTRCLNDRAALIAMLERLQWRPIAEAPKDGARIQVARDMGLPWGYVMGWAYWENLEGMGGGWISHGYFDPPGNLGLAHPTHWMRIISPPSGGGG